METYERVVLIAIVIGVMTLAIALIALVEGKGRQ